MVRKEGVQSSRQHQAKQLSDDWDRIRAIALALRAAGSPGLVTRRVQAGRHKERFRGWVDDIVELGPAWSVGIHQWSGAWVSEDGSTVTYDRLETGIDTSGRAVPLARANMTVTGVADVGAPASICQAMEAIARQHNVAV